jgi:hypothetical protein
VCYDVPEALYRLQLLDKGDAGLLQDHPRAHSSELDELLGRNPWLARAQQTAAGEGGRGRTVRAICERLQLSSDNGGTRKSQSAEGIATVNDGGDNTFLNSADALEGCSLDGDDDEPGLLRAVIGGSPCSSAAANSRWRRTVWLLAVPLAVATLLSLALITLLVCVCFRRAAKGYTP